MTVAPLARPPAAIAAGPRKKDWAPVARLGGLRRFAFAITAFNVLGHTVLGFEQSWLQPFVALATGYAFDLLLETVDARLHRRPARYRGGGATRLIDFLLPAHITSLAITMLLYPNDRLWVLAFAVAIAIGSKSIFRVRIGQGTRHFLNPSNFGIAVTLLLFPWVGIAPPYHFTENLGTVGDWFLPALIVVSGTFLNARYTKRLPLLSAWIGVFVLQAVVRWLVLDAALLPALAPATGVAFVLFTFYMVTDPPTTPSGTRAQILFGGSVAALYGVLLSVHIVFGFFFALALVCTVRGASIALRRVVTVETPDVVAAAPAAAAGRLRR